MLAAGLLAGFGAAQTPTAPAGLQGGAPYSAGASQAGQTGVQTQQNGNQNSQGNSQNSQANQNNRNNSSSRDTNGRDAQRDSQSSSQDNTPDGTRNVIADQPTDFQRLIRETTGSTLPIFGANLFNGVPSTFAPVDDIPVSPEYVIGPGDELNIQLFGQVNQQGSFPVSRTGDISYPDVGTVHVAGLHYGQLQGFLKTQLSRVFRNFDLTVNLGQLRTIQVFVTGYARRPGSYTISSLSTLLNALFASGGPLPTGSLRDIQVLRGETVLVHFDLYDLLLRGDKSKDIAMRPGDVIYIPVVGMQVAVAGSVNQPGIFEVRPGTTVDQAIALSGGRTNVAVGSQVRLERVFEGSMRSIVDVDLARGQDPTVANGDILTIAAIQDRYKDAVTLRGNVSYPGRYVWHPGMKIADLVPSREQLVTRDYFQRRNAEGNFTSGFGNGAAGSLQIRGSGTTQQSDSAAQSGNASPSAGASSLGSALTDSNGVFGAVNDVVLSAPDVDLSYAVVERLDPTTLATVLIPFSPGKLYLQGDQSQNLPLQPGDVVTFFSTADIRVPTQQQTRFVRLEGEFIAPGVYSVQPGETLRHLLVRAGGLTPDAYLYGSQFTRESTRRTEVQRLNEYADNLEAQLSSYTARTASGAISAQDSLAAQASVDASRQAIGRLRRTVPLGRIVLDLKPDSRFVGDIPDISLEDGDRFILPKTPATISVEGQVYSANAFLWQRGRREREYLRQAGGPDREADLSRIFILRADGSIFSTQYGDVARANMFPGDTVVVPPKLTHSAFFRDLVDASAIIGQFGLGAAAIEVFR